MAEFIAVVVGVTAYFVSYKVLYKDFKEFKDALSEFIYFLPLYLIFDYDIWGKPFNYKIMGWLSSGLFIGISAYIFSLFAKF